MSGVENANVRGWRTKFGREFPEVEVKDATVKQTKNRFWFHASGRGGLRFHWYSVGGRKLRDERFGKRFYKNPTPNIQTELTGTLIISIEQIWWDWLGILTRFRLFISVFLTMNSMRADQLRSKAEWIKKTVWCFSKDGNQVKKYGRRQASIREYQNMRETGFPWLFFYVDLAKHQDALESLRLAILSSKRKVEH